MRLMSNGLTPCLALLLTLCNSLSSGEDIQTAGELIELQEQHREEHYPIAWEAIVTTQSRQSAEKRSFYHANLSQNATFVYRNVDLQDSPTNRYKGWSATVETGFAEHILLADGKGFWHSLNSGMRDIEIVADLVDSDAEEQFRQLQRRCPGVREYGLQLFPFTLASATSESNQDLLMGNPSPEYSLSRLADGDIEIRYATEACEVVRTLSPDKGFQLVRYQTATRTQPVHTQTHDFQLALFGSELWFPQTSRYVSQKGEDRLLQIDVDIQRVDFGESQQANRFSLKAIGLPAGIPVNRITDKGTESLIWTGESLSKWGVLPSEVDGRSLPEKKVKRWNAVLLLNFFAMFLVGIGLFYRRRPK